MKRLIVTAIILFSQYTFAGDPPPATLTWSDTSTTGAAMGYCLAKHPYQTLYTGRSYTPDGYEIVASPGVVGAVRRNFVYDRTTDASDEGNSNNSCAKACSEFGKFYGPTYQGAPLHQKVGAKGGALISSGIGDMASLAVKDQDYYLGNQAVAGIWSRGNTWHESDVAQSDFCCCQATAKKTTRLPNNTPVKIKEEFHPEASPQQQN